MNMYCNVKHAFLDETLIKFGVKNKVTVVLSQLKMCEVLKLDF